MRNPPTWREGARRQAGQVARKRGRIIVLSSMQGRHGTKDASSYSASKWGILGLMKSAALELGEYNITVNALIPGMGETGRPPPCFSPRTPLRW